MMRATLYGVPETTIRSCPHNDNSAPAHHRVLTRAEKHRRDLLRLSEQHHDPSERLTVDKYCVSICELSILDAVVDHGSLGFQEMEVGSDKIKET